MLLGATFEAIVPDNATAVLEGGTTFCEGGVVFKGDGVGLMVLEFALCWIEVATARAVTIDCSSWLPPVFAGGRSLATTVEGIVPDKTFEGNELFVRANGHTLV